MPLLIASVAIGMFLYGEYGKPPGYTTGSDVRPLAEYEQRYHVAWLAPEAVPGTVRVVDGDVRFADGRIDTLINSPFDDTEPSESADGEFLVFSSDRSGGLGGYDLYWTRREGRGYAPPKLLPVSSIFHDRSPSLARASDGQYLLLFTSNRTQGGVVDHDLYLSRGRFGGEWSEPRRLDGLSTAADERAAAITPAGDTIVFSRPGRQGIRYFESWAFEGGFQTPGALASFDDSQNEARLAFHNGGTVLEFARGDRSYRSQLRLLREMPRGRAEWMPAWVLLAIALALLLLRLLAYRWRTLEIIYWCLLISLLIHLLLWWLLRDAEIDKPTPNLEGPEHDGGPPIEFALDMLVQESGEAAPQSAQGDRVDPSTLAEIPPTSSSAFERREAQFDAPHSPMQAALAMANDAERVPERADSAPRARPTPAERAEREPMSTALREAPRGLALAAQAEAAIERVAQSESRQAPHEKQQLAAYETLTHDAAAAARATSAAEVAAFRAAQQVVQDQIPDARAPLSREAVAGQLPTQDSEAAQPIGDAVALRTAELAAANRTELDDDSPKRSRETAHDADATAFRPSSTAESAAATALTAPSAADVAMRRAAASTPSAIDAATRAASSIARVLPDSRAEVVAVDSGAPALAEASEAVAKRAMAERSPSGHATTASKSASRAPMVSSASVATLDAPSQAQPDAFRRSLPTSPGAQAPSHREDVATRATPSPLPERSTEIVRAAERRRPALARASPTEVARAEQVTGPSARTVAAPTPTAAPTIHPLGTQAPAPRLSDFATKARPTSESRMPNPIRPRPRSASSELAKVTPISPPVTSRPEPTTHAQGTNTATLVDAAAHTSERTMATLAKPTARSDGPSRDAVESPRLAAPSATPLAPIGSGRETLALHHDSPDRPPTAVDPTPRAVVMASPTSRGARAVKPVPDATTSQPQLAAAERTRPTREESDLQVRRPASHRRGGKRTVPAPLALRAKHGPQARTTPELSAAPKPKLSTESDASDVRVARVPQPKERTDTVPWVSARTGAKKVEALKRFGGDERTERAVALGLEYLANLQQRSGAWNSIYRKDPKYGETAIGTTALAVLAFLGAGHYPGSGSKYSNNVEAGLQFIIDQQTHVGHFGRNTAAYSHGVATYALGEAYLLSREERYLEPLRRAVVQIARHQELDPDRPEFFGGWSYYYHDGHRYDAYPRASVSVWQVMALKTASLAGIDVKAERLEAARLFLANMFSQRYGRFLYNRKPSRLNSQYPTLPGSTPASTFALIVLGHPRDSVAIRSGIESIAGRAPRTWRRADTAQFIRYGRGNPYYWYYATLAMFMHGGEQWDHWNEALKNCLLPSQDRDGSWEPISVYAEYAGDSDSSRAYTTALNVLMLEVYYRYLTPFLEKSKERDLVK